MADSGDLDPAMLEEMFGPPPTREQIIEAADSSDERVRARLMAVLEQCTTTDSASMRYGFDVFELDKKIESREIPGVNHGVRNKWLPRWLVNETEDGDWVFDEGILELWEIWKVVHNGRSFCENFAVFERDEFEGRTCLEVYQQEADDRFEEIKQYMQWIRDPHSM